MKIKILFTLLASLLFSCTCLKQQPTEKTNQLKENTNSIDALPMAVEEKKEIVRGNFEQVAPAIIYKTKADYYDKVPIILSNDKKSVVSYPAPTDLYFRGKLAYPTKLKNGFLLDNRGITQNVAFTKYTYSEYAKLTKAPTEKELLESIIDYSPLLEWANVGARSSFAKDEVGKINKIIDQRFSSKNRLQY